MFKRENIRKNFLRVKQRADQNLGRVEKSEVLSNDLQSSEKRVDVVKHVCSNTVKKLGASLLGSQTSDGEKKLKKMPEAALGHSMIESANILGTDGIMGQLFQMSGDCQSCLAQKHLQYELDTEKNVVEPFQEILEVQIPQIFRLKKALNKVTLDMDSAKNRWNAAVKQTQVPGVNMASASAKADTVKDEFEEASNRVDQARDALTTGLFNFISREAEHSQNLLSLLEAQSTYHREALDVIEKVIPRMRESLSCNPTKPVYGVPLEEHLRVTNRDIAQVLEDSICFLIETGLDEEGLFRIAGMASKVKKLKASFDAGVDFDDNGELDQHTVAGAMKQYLRELPEPLLTFDLFPDFMSAIQKPADQRLQAIWCVVDKLPKPNYDNFKYLIKFLSKLTERSAVNKMTPSNIAIVIGPNLMWSEGDSGPNMANTGILSLITEMIVQNADWFFPGDPDEMARYEPAHLDLHCKHWERDVDYRATQRGAAPDHNQQQEAPELTPAAPKPSIPNEISSPAAAAIAGSSKPTAPIPARRLFTEKIEGVPALPVPPRRSRSIVSATSSEATTLSNQSLSAYENAETLERRDSGAGSNSSTEEKRKSGTFPAAITTSANNSTKSPNPVITFSPKDRVGYKGNGVGSVPSPRPTPLATPPTQNVHSDMYDTAFALQSLGNGAPSYLSKVRTIWDDQLQRTPTSDVSVIEKSTPTSSSSVPTVTKRTKVLDVDYHATRLGAAPDHIQQQEAPELKTAAPKPSIPNEISSPATAAITGRSKPTTKPRSARKSMKVKSRGVLPLPVPACRSMPVDSFTSSMVRTVSLQSLSGHENSETLERWDSDTGLNKSVEIKHVDYRATRRGAAPDHIRQQEAPELKTAAPKPSIPNEISSSATAAITGRSRPTTKPRSARKSMKVKSRGMLALPVPACRSMPVDSFTSSMVRMVSYQSLSANDSGTGHNKSEEIKHVDYGATRHGAAPDHIQQQEAPELETAAPKPSIPNEISSPATAAITGGSRSTTKPRPARRSVKSRGMLALPVPAGRSTPVDSFTSSMVTTLSYQSLSANENAETLERWDSDTGHNTSEEIKHINFGCSSESPISFKTPESQSHANLERAGSSHSVSSHGTPQSSPSPVANHDRTSPLAPPQTPPTMSRSPSVSPGNSQVNLSQAPLAESEELTPIARRQARKPAPPPPERPYTVAVSASVRSSQSQQHKTWPRYAVPPQLDGSTLNTMSQFDKQRTLPPERPHPPERVSSLVTHHGHSDRPKVPPPVVPPGHQRSASTGGPTASPQLHQSLSSPMGEFGEGQRSFGGTDDGDSGSTSGNSNPLSQQQDQFNANSLSRPNKPPRPHPPPPPTPASDDVEETHL